MIKKCENCNDEITLKKFWNQEKRNPFYYKCEKCNQEYVASNSSKLFSAVICAPLYIYAFTVNIFLGVMVFLAYLGLLRPLLYKFNQVEA